MARGDRPQWQLPPGVPRGVWEYAQAEQIALDYDGHFQGSPLFEFDAQVLADCFRQPGLVVDLGCGTGRALVPLARRGLRCLGVDLSRPMLEVVGRKQAEESLPIGRIQANLVELDCLRDEVADYCTCLFSTLGMIRGRTNRGKALAHARRILKPGGLFVVHVHNTWNRVFDAAGRRWLAVSFSRYGTAMSNWATASSTTAGWRSCSSTRSVGASLRVRCGGPGLKS